MDNPPLGGFPDAWARRKWIMYQTLGGSRKLILLVLEAHADIDTGAVIGPQGRNFALADLAVLTGVKRSTLSVRLRNLEAEGYLRVERFRGRGIASRYFLTNPLKHPDSGWGVVQELDGAVQELDGVVQELDGGSPKAGHEVPPYPHSFNPLSLPRAESADSGEREKGFIFKDERANVFQKTLVLTESLLAGWVRSKLVTQEEADAYGEWKTLQERDH